MKKRNISYLKNKMWCLQSNGKSESEILNEQITIYNRTIKYNKLYLESERIKQL